MMPGLHALYSVRNSWTAVSEERVPSTEAQGPVFQHSDSAGRGEEHAPLGFSWRGPCTFHTEKITMAV